MKSLIKHQRAARAECSSFELAEMAPAPTVRKPGISSRPAATSVAEPPVAGATRGDRPSPPSTPVVFDKSTTADPDGPTPSAAVLPAEARDTELCAAAATALATAVQQVERLQHTWHATAEQRVVEIALAIASHVVRQSVTQMPELPLHLVRESLALLPHKETAHILLNPGDYERLRAHLPDIVDSDTGAVTVQPDEAIEPGGCRLQTTGGLIDQTPQAQLQRIRDELLPG